ncbi:hypothetical protein KGY79_09165 [Candidatus Bipolaricaulota bacterium]|nr:hypothetical protein [Candidatus Bipolaricaulota bacterium]
MKKVFLFCLIIGILSFSLSPGEAKRIHVFETSPKVNVDVQFSDPRPVIIHATGENTWASTHVITGNYKDFVEMKSQGQLDFTQMVGHTDTKLNTSGNGGKAIAERITQNYKNYLELNSNGDLDLTQLASLENIEVSLMGKDGTAQVETQTEKYKNQGEVNSKGEILLNGNARLGSSKIHIQGTNGSARVLTTTEFLKNGGSITSLGDLSLSTVLSNPKIKLEIDGKSGNAAAQALSDMLYNNELTVNSSGKISLSQLADRHQVFLHLDWNRGDVTNKTSTPNQETTVVLENAEGKLEKNLTVEKINNGEENNDKNNPGVKNSTKNSGDTEDSSQEETSTTSKDSSDNSSVSARAKLGAGNGGRLTIIRMNPRGSEPVASDAEIVSRRLGMDINRAQNYISDNGGMSKINYAWNKSSSFNPKPPTPAVAGKAGGLSGPTSIDIGTLSRPEVYKLHLKGPKYKGFLRNSELYMRLYFPTNNRQIRGVYTTITVAEPIQSNNILLVQELSYDYEGDFYRYSFDKEDWLVDFASLEGPYVLLIDAGQSLNVELPITITENGEIKPRNGS